MLVRKFWSRVCLTGVCVVFLTTAVQARIVDKVAAKVNERIITMSDVERTLKIFKLENPDKAAKIKTHDPQTLSFFLRQLISVVLIEEELKKTGRQVTDKEVDAAYRSIKKQNKMTDKQFNEYLEKSGLTMQDYRTALRQKIERIRFFNTHIKTHISITPEDIKAYYDSHQRRFQGAEKVKIAEIFIPVSADLTSAKRLKRQNLIMKIESDLYKGKKFSELVKAYHSNPIVKINEDLGWFERGTLAKAIAEKAFSLKKGGVSNIIETKSGFHIIKVLDITHVKHISLKEATSEIKSMLYRREMGKKLDEWMKNSRKDAQIEIMM